MMPSPVPPATSVAVLGAGTMGAGIAHVAAAAGHRVRLYDTSAGVVEQALRQLEGRLDRSVAKGRTPPADAASIMESIAPAGELDEMADAGLVIEAIVEDLGVKREVFRKLEAIISDEAILATNTSSLSVTAIAAALDHPQRLVGMHFFNPAPVMPLVEIVSGAATSTEVAETTHATAAAWGKTPVHCASTPGFIVNRVARPFYSENLRLLQEGVATMATIDGVLTGAGGFRMGPFALMDLVGLDVNLAVSRSVYEQTFHDPRFAPSVLQQAKVDAGHLGRKTGSGWYDSAGDPASPATLAPGRPAGRIAAPPAAHAELLARLGAAGLRIDRRSDVDHIEMDGIALYPTDGRSAAQLVHEGHPTPLVVMDLVLDWATADRIAVAAPPSTPDSVLETVAGTFHQAGMNVSVIADLPGLIVMRTIAQLVSVAADAAMTGVATPADIDTAMRLGTNYPGGPFEWADRIGVESIVGVFDALHRFYGEDRYRCAAWLRRAYYDGVSLRALQSATD